MKKILKISVLFIATLLVVTSCTDESKNPLPEFERGAFLSFTKTAPAAVDFTVPAQAIFNAEAIDYNQNIESVTYTLIHTAASGTVTEVENAVTINSFPHQFTYGPSELASLLEVETTALAFGDNFRFRADKIVRKDGTVFNASEPEVTRKDKEEDPTEPIESVNGGTTDKNLLSSGYRNAIDFNWYFSCPFNAEEALGTYEIVVDTWEPGYKKTFEVIAGSNPGEVIAVEPLMDGLNMTITVDTATGVVSLDDKEQTWRISHWSSNPAYTGGYMRIKGPSFFFSCSGTIDLTYQPRIDQGGWSNQRWVAKKIQ